MRSTPWKTRRAGPPKVTASPDSSRNERVGALAGQSADAEQGRIAQRQRHDRRGKLLLVAVLMQAHARVRVVEVDEAGLGRRRVRRELPPRRRAAARASAATDARSPGGSAGSGSRPRRETQPSEPQLLILDRERLAGPGHPGAVERRLREDGEDRVAQALLGGAIEIAGEIGDARGDGDGGAAT